MVGNGLSYRVVVTNNTILCGSNICLVSLLLACSHVQGPWLQL